MLQRGSKNGEVPEGREAGIKEKDGLLLRQMGRVAGVWCVACYQAICFQVPILQQEICSVLAVVCHL